MGVIMGSDNTVKSLNGLFKEIYADKIQYLIPKGVTLRWVQNFWSMPIDMLAKHVEYNEEAAQVFKTRSSKLGKYLEGHD